MKVDAQCSYCLLSRIHYESKLSTDDEILINNIMQECIKVLNDTYAPGVPAALVSTSMHRKAYELLNDEDPYRDMKELCNRTAEKVLPIAESLIYEGENSETELFRRAVLAAVIGNFFDFGVMGLEVPISVFDETFRQHFMRGLDIDDTNKMFEMLDNVVYVADNCGEILLDTLVFDIIKKIGGHVTLVVRGMPILTDVTMKEIYEWKIDRKVDRVLTTGSGSIGVDLELAPKQLLEAFDCASLIISKGMANYETLTEHDIGPIAYLLKAKCKPVARHIGVEVGHSVAKLCE
ncbi:MAG: DUF89 family protein [Methanomethylovorans sp.]|jgi:hypothetical protein|nr:DUF89 family protein [Methanomethylovorans sp.]